MASWGIKVMVSGVQRACWKPPQGWDSLGSQGGRAVLGSNRPSKSSPFPSTPAVLSPRGLTRVNTRLPCWMDLLPPKLYRAPWLEGSHFSLNHLPCNQKR